jgi:hypothetical protein
MISLLENMFDSTEFDVMKSTELVGTIKVLNGKYHLVVTNGIYKSSSTHHSLEDAYETALELLEK